MQRQAELNILCRLLELLSLWPSSVYSGEVIMELLQNSLRGEQKIQWVQTVDDEVKPAGLDQLSVKAGEATQREGLIRDFGSMDFMARENDQIFDDMRSDTGHVTDDTQR